VILICMVVSWIFIHRWNQRNKKGPKTWPFLGAAIEQLMNYDRMHDWLVQYFSMSKTVVVPMPFTTYTYIADPINVEHVLKTNFNNYPKVINPISLQLSLLILTCLTIFSDRLFRKVRVQFLMGIIVSQILLNSRDSTLNYQTPSLRTRKLINFF
jgi:hypothetical protein